MYMVDPYFGPEHLNEPTEEYVAWIDLMGTGAIMEWSEDVASTNIGKIQIVMARWAESYDIDIYPMMDGSYAVSDDQDNIMNYIAKVFRQAAQILLNRHSNEDLPPVHFSPIPRGGLSKGNVYHGYQIEGTDLDEYDIQNSILIGQPVAQAHKCENDASPFGCSVHPSARQKDHLSAVKWWMDGSYVEAIVEALKDYFDYYQQNSDVNYSRKKIQQHRDMAIGQLLINS